MYGFLFKYAFMITADRNSTGIIPNHHSIVRVQIDFSQVSVGIWFTDTGILGLSCLNHSIIGPAHTLSNY